jgi:nitronate monooxygenase
MAGQTTPKLVAAVSNAGGPGILGATRMTPDKLLDAIRKIKMLTAEPYGVNLWLGPQEKSKKNQDMSSVQDNIHVYLSSFSNPIPLSVYRINELRRWFRLYDIREFSSLLQVGLVVDTILVLVLFLA